MADLIQFRRDTKERWEAINPTLAEGELGLEIDTQRQKIGDGVHAWNDLKYSIIPAVKDIFLKSGSGKMIVQLVKTDDAKQELTIPEATSTTDGVMSATDKLNLDDAVNSIVSTIGKYDITLRVSKNNGNSYSVVLPSATVRTAGLMTASDKFNLDDVYTGLQSLTKRVEKLEKSGGGGGDCDCESITDEELEELLS